MKQKLLPLIICILVSFAAKTQAFKAGVFDIDLMVQAMPGYDEVDSLMDIYMKDSLQAERDYYYMEYHRLDSTYKADSALVATGQKPATFLTFITEERRKMGLNVLYWPQIAQNKSNMKRRQLAQPLYLQVSNAYRKILVAKKYSLILKPQTYEAGFPIDNIFLSVARELKLTSLPQELLYLGDDPDAVKPPNTTKPPASKPKTN